MDASFLVAELYFHRPNTAQARIPEVMMDAKPAWFMETEGQRVVEKRPSWQTSAGSWPKMWTRPVSPSRDPLELRGTFDNAATTGEMRSIVGLCGDK